jgi:putative tryptophan/tyrosine transport system substrate-binding protein
MLATASRARGTHDLHVGVGNSSTGTAYDAFYAGMRDLGYVEGRNVSCERRWANGQPDRLPALAAELVALRVDVIVASFDAAIAAATAACQRGDRVRARPS